MRWLHLAWALARTGLDAATTLARWIDRPANRTLGWPIALALLAAIAIPFDRAISAWFETARPTGDLRRELEALQQFGQLAFSLVIAAAVFLLDRPRARKLLDWIAGAVLCAIAVSVLKGVTGRPRPVLGDPYHLVGPAGLYPVPSGHGYRMESPWTSGYELASFPSRHACFAALCAVFLCALQPRLRPLAIGMATIVTSARVILGAHYTSDALAGAALGLLIGGLACSRWWGVRAVDALWRRWVDPHAVPALPRLQGINRT